MSTAPYQTGLTISTDLNKLYYSDGKGQLIQLLDENDTALAGADKTGIADSTAAFNALTTDLRAALVNVDYDYIPFKITIPPGIYSISSWDLTSLLGRRVEIHMHGAVLIARTASKHVIDLIGSRWVTLHGGVIYSASGVVAKSAVQCGPKGTETCGNNAFYDVMAVGYYSHAALMNLGSETTSHYGCTWLNRNTAAGAYGEICDGLSTYLPTSDYATITRGAGVAVSFTTNVYIATQVRNEGGGSAHYLAKTDGWLFDAGCYHLSFNDSAFVLYASAAGRNSNLTANGLFENSQDNNPTPGNIGIRYCFTLDNDGAATAIDGFACDSFGPHCETYFMRNIGGGTYRISGAKIRVQQLPQAGAVFFSGGAGLALDGEIQTSDAAALNLAALTSFNGHLHVDSYSALASLPVAGAYTVQSRSSASVLYGGTHDFTGEPVAFTPAATFATPGDLSVSYATQTASYTKVGRLVSFVIGLTFTPTYTTASGNLRITGLPFLSKNTTNQNFAIAVNNINSAFTWPASTTQVSGRIMSNTQYIELYGHGTGVASTVFTIAHAPSGTAKTLQLSGWYFSAS